MGHLISLLCICVIYIFGIFLWLLIVNLHTLRYCNELNCDLFETLTLQSLCYLVSVANSDIFLPFLWLLHCHLAYIFLVIGCATSREHLSAPLWVDCRRWRRGVLRRYCYRRKSTASCCSSCSWPPVMWIYKYCLIWNKKLHIIKSGCYRQFYMVNYLFNKTCKKMWLVDQINSLTDLQLDVLWSEELRVGLCLLGSHVVHGVGAHPHLLVERLQIWFSKRWLLGCVNSLPVFNI